METPRLLLRRWKPLDFQAFLRFAGDPEVIAPAVEASPGPAGGGDPVPPGPADEAATHGAEGTGEPIGKIKFQEDLRRFRVNSLSIGYELARAYWGRGLMTEALRAMLEFAFVRLHLNRVEAMFDVRNRASGRVMEKCGMRREGLLRQKLYNKGEYVDVEIWAILARDRR